MHTGISNTIISQFFNKRIGSLIPPISQDYYVRQILPDGNNQTERTDGQSIFSYNGDLYKIFGWDGTDTNLAKVYKSTDKGITWTAEPDAPFISSEQLATVRNDGKVWIFNTPSQVVYTYDSVNGFTLISSSAPPHYAGIRMMHKDKMYIIGGQSSVGAGEAAVIDRNVWMSTDGTFTSIATLPEDFWITTGDGWSDGTNMYITGGASVIAFTGQTNFFNDKIWKSADDGLTWTVHATLPSDMRTMWPNIKVWNGRTWYLNGTDVYRGANQTGLYVSDNNGLTWELFTDEIPGRHASPMEVYDDCLYIGWGNFWNDLWRIEKITYPDIEFADPCVQTYWEKLWPEKRSSLPMITALNNFVARNKADVSLTGTTSNHEEIDWLSVFAGLEYEDQMLIPLMTSNTSFENYTRKIGSPLWTTNGVSGVLPSSMYEGLWRADLHGVKYQNNSAGITAWLISDISSNGINFGHIRGYIYHETNLNFYPLLNSTNDLLQTGTDTKGLRSVYRTNGTQVTSRRNGVTQLHSNTSNAVGTTNLFIGGSYLGAATTEILGVGVVHSGYLDLDKFEDSLIAYYTEREVTYE